MRKTNKSWIGGMNVETVSSTHHIDIMIHWRDHVVRTVVQPGRSTYCLDCFRLKQILFRLVWIGSRERHFVWPLPFRRTMATNDTNPYHKCVMLCFWWCEVGKLIHLFHSNGCTRVSSNVANTQRHCIYQWCRIFSRHQRQRILLHDPFENSENEAKKH